jgi:hypothetical protein
MNVATKQNFKTKQEQKRNLMLAAGLVSDRLPGVSNIVFHMTYYHRTPGPALMTRTMTFLPADYACFRVDCVREECSNGGFDLAPVVTKLVKSRKKTSKGSLFCRGKSESLRTGHASIAYEITVEYSRQKKSGSVSR